ncbi:HNH endonuclease [Caldifermentibacillus hisashii]|uniref:HNH endonuclease n=1 Tax=Caldifermentibacillus hisashii TaxID=996558 RepID=UPI0034D4932C
MEKHGELFCEACNFSFNKIYEIDFIEAHHILPLHKGKRVTKKIDLIMLCANCHRAVHNKKWNDKPIDDFLEYMKNHYRRINGV